jgi:hypothetical protein
MEKEKFLYLPHALIYLYTLHIIIRLTFHMSELKKHRKRLTEKTWIINEKCDKGKMTKKVRGWLVSDSKSKNGGGGGAGSISFPKKAGVRVALILFF